MVNKNQKMIIKLCVSSYSSNLLISKNTQRLLINTENHISPNQLRNSLQGKESLITITTSNLPLLIQINIGDSKVLWKLILLILNTTILLNLSMQLLSQKKIRKSPSLIMSMNLMIGFQISKIMLLISNIFLTTYQLKMSLPSSNSLKTLLLR